MDKKLLHEQLRIARKELDDLEQNYLDGDKTARQQLVLVRAINAKSARIERLERELEGLQNDPLLKAV